MNVLFFPDNKLGVTVCPIYNGHVAIVSQNTDRLKDGKHELAEINLFRHNIQGTSFLNPSAVVDGENANYAQTLSAVGGSGRISFGMYYRTDKWISPVSGLEQQIPDYYLAEWTAAGEAVFANAVAGQAKPVRYPNHGQQFYDVSSGALGYDFVSQQYGTSNAAETIDHTAQQIAYFDSLAGLSLTAGSYANGRSEAAGLLIPGLLGMRTSSYSFAGDGNVSYSLDRFGLLTKASTTRAWDAANAGQFASQAESLTYMQSQVQLAIAEGGWFSDFMHWHSVYDQSDTDFFDPFYSAIDEAIGASDVWRAGNNEAAEYLMLRESIDKIGSFFDGGRAYIFVRFNDVFAGTSTNGISNELPSAKVSSPLSVRVNLSGTPLDGLDITCARATNVRKMGVNDWIISFAISELVDGYFMVELAAGVQDYYSPVRPVLSYTLGQIQADLPCKFVVWRSQSGAGHDVVYRSDDFELSASLALDPAYDYDVGGITQSRVSSLARIA